MKKTDIQRLVIALAIPLTSFFLPLTSHAQNGTWTLFDTRTSDICGNNISALAADGASIWAGTYQGLCRMKGASWTDYAMFNEKLENQSVNCLMMDDRGVLWIGTDDYGVIEWDGTSWTEHNEVTRRLKMKFVKEMVFDHDGVLWIGVTLGGIVTYNGNEWEKYTPDDSGLLSDFILDLAVDQTNRKWITTNSGISIFDGKRWTSFTTANSGLPDNIVPTVAIDSNNVKWFGTLAGLARYDGSTWRVWNTKNSTLPGNQVNDISIDRDGLLWMATDGGVAVFDGENNWVVFTSKNSALPQGNIYKSAHDEQGNHWFGNDSRGLARLSGFTMPAAPAGSNNSIGGKGQGDEQVRITPYLDQGFITIAFPSNRATVKFVNSNGKTVKKVDNYVAGQKIKIDRLPKGMYTVVISSSRGDKKIKFNLK